MRTGDILHTRRWGNIVSFFIRLGTAPGSILNFKWAASHTALIVQEGGELMVYESRFGEGVSNSPFDVWVKKNKDYRLTPVHVTTRRHAIGRAARALHGYDYENVLEMWKIPFNKKGRTSKDLFCTEFVLRVYDMAGVGFGLDPENTSPEEFRQYLEGEHAQS